MATTKPYNVGMTTKQLIIRLSVPEHLDPYSVLMCMGDDFYYANRESEDIGPYLDKITVEVIEEVQQ